MWFGTFRMQSVPAAQYALANNAATLTLISGVDHRNTLPMHARIGDARLKRTTRSPTTRRQGTRRAASCGALLDSPISGIPLVTP